MKHLFLFCIVFFATATQFRLGDFPFGVSEGAAVAYFSCLIFEKKPYAIKLQIYKKYISPLAVLFFALNFFVAIGLLVNLFTVNSIESKYIIDFVALNYAFVVAVAIVLDCCCDAKALKYLIYGFGCYVLLMIVLFFLQKFGLQVSSINLWYSGDDVVGDGSRFQGWSVNPNQIGINLIGFIFLFYIFLIKAENKFFKMFCLILLMASLYLARMIESTTIFAIAISLVVIYCTFHLIKADLVLVRLGLFLILLVGSVLSLIYTEELVDIFYSNIINKGTDGELNGRLPIWLNSILVVWQSPFFGFGPGAHSGITGQHQGVESHSVYLDIATQGGIFAAIAYFSMAVYLVRMLKRHNASFIYWLPFLAVNIYQMSHYTLRHPLFWVMLMSPIFLIVRKKIF